MATTVSVLIPCYNAAAFLPAALDCLRSQSFKTWELVVVEDGSKDETEDIVLRFAAEVSQPVRYSNLGTNRGVSAARNRLLELSSGDYLAFLDADDLWRPAHLATILHTLQRGKHALAFSGIELWDADSRRITGSYQPSAAFLPTPRRSLFFRSFIQTSSCVAMPRSTVVRTGWFDEDFRIGEDRDYWFRAVADGGTLGFTGTNTCCYTKHAGSSMTGTMRVASDTVRFYEKHARAHDIPSGIRTRLLADSRWNYARLLRHLDPVEARSLGWQAWRATPMRPNLLLWCLFASFARSNGTT